MPGLPFVVSFQDRIVVIKSNFSRVVIRHLVFPIACTLLSGLSLAQQDLEGVAYNQIRVQLTPRQQTILSSEVAGRIEAIPRREGDSFTKGQELVKLDCTLHSTRLEKAKALSKEAGSIEQVNVELNKLGSISTLEFSAAVARKAVADSELSLMSAIVERCSIKAPFSGKVVQVSAQPFQFVAEGQELIEIIDDTELSVELFVPSGWLTGIREGQQFSLEVEETGKTYPAEIERIGARIDPVSQTVRLFARISGSFPELRVGMSGSASLSMP